MQNNYLLALVASCTLLLPACKVAYPTTLSDRSPVSHDGWTKLLQEHVNDEGFVDYQGFIQDSALLNQYLNLLSTAHPQKAWPDAEQMAYWINAYNAFTVKLILDHYPVESIKDIKSGIAFVNSVWDIKFIDIQGQQYDLNNIEHGILRPHFNDARIHGAINCASYSCPRLRDEAYVPERLDEQLDDAMRQFINDPRRNKISRDQAQISEIFKWFSGDFKEDAGSVREFINRYAEEPIGANVEIGYVEYDWRLNDVR